jgi:hypothetical protein
MKGYNEVVIFRRLPERHKLAVSRLLADRDQTTGKFDALYKQPHDDDQVGGRMC